MGLIIIALLLNARQTHAANLIKVMWQMNRSECLMQQTNSPYLRFRLFFFHTLMRGNNIDQDQCT
ncbi:hypothetical protein C5L22_09405 [Pantoea ananatis]|nr:hypothetical protein B9D02_14270 [Pantoea vagans]PQL28825.1 hypothetical protein C5L22_09405 [Pantoea ananatis]